jgi:YesN/AraC family two-component response regulator
MIRMVISDDEQIIRQGLLSIDWDKQGIKVLGVESDGVETLGLIRERKPQILLADI